MHDFTFHNSGNPRCNERLAIRHKSSLSCKHSLFNITMPVPHAEAPAYLASHAGVLGKGWTEVDTLESLDPDEYELEEVSRYPLGYGLMIG
jgi:hypothetical protein